MIKLIAITFSIILSVIMVASVSWFEKEQEKIERINKNHLKDIQKLKKISQINSWLDSIVKPKLKITPANEDLADDNLVRYFDTHSKELNLQVSRYIYADDVAKHMIVTYEVKRSKLQELKKLMNLYFKEGFLQFRELHVDEKTVKGTIELVQPFNGENNVSK